MRKPITAVATPTIVTTSAEHPGASCQQEAADDDRDDGDDPHQLDRAEQQRDRRPQGHAPFVAVGARR